MYSTSRCCASIWKSDINHRRYEKVVVEIFAIANMHYGENNKYWIDTMQSIITKLDDMSDRRIMPHIRKYLKDFLNVAIRAIKGKCGKKEFRSERERTMKLLAIAYCS